jgi:hypothetical protein
MMCVFYLIIAYIILYFTLQYVGVVIGTTSTKEGSSVYQVCTGYELQLTLPKPSYFILTKAVELHVLIHFTMYYSTEQYSTEQYSTECKTKQFNRSKKITESCAIYPLGAGSLLSFSKFIYNSLRIPSHVHMPLFQSAADHIS